MMSNIFIREYLIGLLFTGLFVSANAGSAPERQLLEAMERNRAASYTVTLANPYREITGESDLIPYAPDWVFYRFYRNGELFLRLEERKDGQLVGAYVKNSEGIFGFYSNGFAAEILDVPPLWYPELIHLETPADELAICSFEETTVRIGSENYTKISVITPKNAGDIQKLTGEAQGEFKKRWKYYKENRPFVREFFIGSDGLIQILRHYNYAGKLIFDLNLAGMELLAGPDDSLFATPPDLKGLFINRSSFGQQTLSLMIERQKPSIWSGIGQWFAKACRIGSPEFINGCSVLLTLAGIGGIGLVCTVRLHNRRRAEAGRRGGRKH